MLSTSPNTPSAVYCWLFEEAGLSTLEYLGTTVPSSKCEFNKKKSYHEFQNMVGYGLH